MAMGGFSIDKYPVTNVQYAAFLTETGYTPAGDLASFLRHWPARTGTNRSTSRWRHAAATGNKPVVYVSLDDARAYCAHQHKRLPNEWEWSYAAQGLDGRKWPWGKNMTPSPDKPCMPPAYTGRARDVPLPDVRAFDGNGCASPFGAQLLVGSVWQWTNSIADSHTRVGLLKGGSVYWRTDDGPALKNRSIYYFPNCARQMYHGSTGIVPIEPLQCHGQYLLMDGSYERASTVGFRCLQDSASAPIPPTPVTTPRN
jgi:formylglycine-generating enzyme required for sulfatase activity